MASNGRGCEKITRKECRAPGGSGSRPLGCGDDSYHNLYTEDYGRGLEGEIRLLTDYSVQ
jgi:hypothetical protein